MVCGKREQSGYHTYTDVLRKLMQNNLQENKIKWKLQQKKVNSRKYFKKMAEKEIENKVDGLNDTLIEFSEEKKLYGSNGIDDEDSDETTTVGATQINNLLLNMVINPRKKLEIDI